MHDSKTVTGVARRRLRRDDEGKLIDEVSGEVVAVESLGASVLDGERFSVTDANGRDVTFSVLRDVAAMLLGVTPSAAERGGAPAVGGMLSALTGQVVSTDLLRRLQERAR